MSQWLPKYAEAVAEKRRKRREAVAAKPRPGLWFPIEEDDVRVCARCKAEKPRAEFGRADGWWHSATCKDCVAVDANERRSLKMAREPEERSETPNRVAQMCYCADCAARGIISPVPAGKRCPFHSPEFVAALTGAALNDVQCQSERNPCSR